MEAPVATPADRLFRFVAQPPMASWPTIASARAANDPLPADVLALLDEHAARLGSQPAIAPRGPLWFTGHQAWLWHPGILAKDIAAAVAADRLGGQAVHLVVDHDIHDALMLDVPVQRGRRLAVHALTLAPSRVDLPAACQPPADARVMLQTLDHATATLPLAVDLAPLRQAVVTLVDQPFDTLGQQMATLTQTLMRPWTGPMAMLLTSQLHRLAAFDALVQAMLQDPLRCARAYNQAVASHPQAGMSQLAISREWVELPLWVVAWGAGRQPVYADIADSQAQLVTRDGRPVVLTPGVHGTHLAPRALTLTALCRHHLATLFIHGMGGGVYDRVMEDWWHAWRPGLALAPLAMVTADLRLTFDVPAASRDDLAQAIWQAHHLRHHLDRHAALPVAAKPLAQRKAELLAHMDDDRDPSRRAAAFREMVAINRQLAGQMPHVLAAADVAVETARAGLLNHAIAMKRDWPFALYNQASLRRLVDVAQAAQPG